MQTRIRCVLMRGGTSKGPIFLAEDLPRDPALRDKVLLRVMGSPDWRQIDGVGGADTLTSKVVILSPSERPEVDVDYLFAQVAVDRPIVDMGATCGNMLAAIGPYLIEEGIVPARAPETMVRIHLVNIDAHVEAIVQTPDGEVDYEGDAEIAGVPGRGAPIKLAYRRFTGSKTRRLLPTGGAVDTIDGVRASCVDASTPMVICPAAELGKTGYETKQELDADRGFFERLEAVRREAAAKMGMGDVTDSVLPKFAIVAPPRAGGDLAARYFVPTNTHAGMAVTGGICLATAAAIPGSVVAEITGLSTPGLRRFTIEHPSGTFTVETETRGSGASAEVVGAAMIRTARRLFEGSVLIPAACWDGRQ
jgi:2-methylaconitate cis-trans-isomerase PrpF